MKANKIIIAITLFSTFFSLTAQRKVIRSNDKGQESPLVQNGIFKNMIHLMPLSMTVGGLEAGYEQVVKEKQSIFFSGGFFLSQNAGGLSFNGNYQNLTGFKSEFQYRFYKRTINHRSNIFLAPSLLVKTTSAELTSYNVLTNKEEITTQSASSFALGYMLGVRNNVMDNIFVDFMIGGGINLPISGDAHKELHVPFFSPYQRGTQIRAGFNVVIALN